MKSCCEIAGMFQRVCLDCNRPKRTTRTPAMKNLCGKMRPKTDPYEVWQAGSWTWQVLKKWQADDAKPYARWFCNVITPMVPEGDSADKNPERPWPLPVYLAKYPYFYLKGIRTIAYEGNPEDCTSPSPDLGY